MSGIIPRSCFHTENKQHDVWWQWLRNRFIYLPGTNVEMHSAFDGKGMLCQKVKTGQYRNVGFRGFSARIWTYKFKGRGEGARDYISGKEFDLVKILH